MTNAVPMHDIIIARRPRVISTPIIVDTEFKLLARASLSKRTVRDAPKLENAAVYWFQQKHNKGTVPLTRANRLVITLPNREQTAVKLIRTMSPIEQDAVR